MARSRGGLCVCVTEVTGVGPVAKAPCGGGREAALEPEPFSLQRRREIRSRGARSRPVAGLSSKEAPR
ncbi:Hypothetical predicted protein [Podarcis lilfordi]|uniref:Uncharacterized protein n=1 Tax=Podarcis lilfordi TaxID=74358 RepID=A0AA35LJ57_9SAUR|nr:Hypothetical predicted protein [Podarcis lilfordi]